MADKAVIQIEGDNSHLKKTLAESKAMLAAFQASVHDTMGGVSIGGGGGGKGGGGGGKPGSPVPAMPFGTEVITGLLGKLSLVAIAIHAIKAGLELVHKAFEDLQEDELSLVKLEAALAKMGANAGTTSGEIQKIGEALEHSTMYTKEMAQDAATVLLRFRNIKNESGGVFDKALKTSADLAAYMGSDMTSAARQLGRALEDPVAGLGEMSRMGIKLTEHEKQRVQLLVETGRGLQAQEIILKRINDLVEGQAEAQGNTLKGALTQLGNAGMDFLKAPFEIVLPVVTEIVLLVKDLLLFFKDIVVTVIDFGGVTSSAFELLAGGIREARNLFGIFVDAVMIGVKALEIGFLQLGSVVEEIWGGNSMTLSLAKRKEELMELVEAIKKRSGDVGSLFFKKDKGSGGEDTKADFGNGGRQSIGTFEALEALYKRIASAASGATPADRAAEAGEKQVAQLERANTELMNVNANLIVLTAQLPAPGVLG